MKVGVKTRFVCKYAHKSIVFRKRQGHSFGKYDSGKDVFGLGSKSEQASAE